MIPPMRIFFRFAVLVFAVFAAPGSAVAGSNLYQALVPVSGSGDDGRNAGLRDALAAVLVRIGGDRRLPYQAEAQPILDRAAALAQGYGFEKSDHGPQLRAVFDARAVDAALRDAGLPVWNAKRPLHLLWIAADDNGSGTIYTRNDKPRIAALLDAAETRGVPVVLPENPRLTFNDIAEGARDALHAASLPYNAGRIVSVRLYLDGGGWSSQWRLYGNREVQSEWTTTADSADSSLAQGLHRLADYEAQQFAARSGGGSRDVRIEVGGLASPADYARALNYLRGLSGATAVAVESAQTPYAVFRLRTDSDEDDLSRMIGAGQTLRAAEARDGDALGYVLTR